jgi:hypothetical protein
MAETTGTWVFLKYSKKHLIAAPERNNSAQSSSLTGLVYTKNTCTLFPGSLPSRGWIYDGFTYHHFLEGPTSPQPRKEALSSWVNMHPRPPTQDFALAKQVLFHLSHTSK